MQKITLTEEQQKVVDAVAECKHVLVDACIGSGKTSVLETIYRKNTKKRIIYLTFNKLLKLEAKTRLPKRQGSVITNYHGFVYPYLKLADVSSSIAESLLEFTKAFDAGKVRLPHWDLLLIDEYQDINEQMAGVLERIRRANPDIQIVAVGDMAQKIYDNTRLDVQKWISEFLGDYVLLELTTCFRLSKGHAAVLGRIWGKTINGVNEACVVDTISFEKALEIAANHAPSDILCLGSKTGMRNYFQNALEDRQPKKFNKTTLYASIDDDGGRTDTAATGDAAVFTTFDSSKGMERGICFIFDFTAAYWYLRAAQPSVRYQILRNIFCVAASRGKRAVYFVEEDECRILSEKELSTQFDIERSREFEVISKMFNFKFKELVDECYELLEVEKLPVSDTTPIEVATRDGFIDLTPCIGIYQEATYFRQYDQHLSWDAATNNVIKYSLAKQKISEDERIALKQHVLYMTAIETSQMRYATQVDVDFMPAESEAKLRTRIGELLATDVNAQVECTIDFDGFKALGRCDVLHEGVVYELKFVSELSREHFLQCACYVVALGITHGILWNTRDNTRYIVRVPNEHAFKAAVRRVVMGC